MLIIRQEQIAAFSEVALGRFDEEMVIHVRDYFPVDYDLLGEHQVLRAVHLGLHRALEHGFRTKGQLCRYVDLAISLGGHFDADPLLPWAAEILDADLAIDAQERIERLDETALDWIGRVLGEDGEHYRRALLRARRLSLEDLDPEEENLNEAVRALGHRLHPELFREVDDRQMNELLLWAVDYFDRFDLLETRNFMLLAGVMMLLGTHAVVDPWSPWVAEALEMGRPADSGEKGKILYDRAMTYLDDALQRMRSSRET